LLLRINGSENLPVAGIAWLRVQSAEWGGRESATEVRLRSREHMNTSLKQERAIDGRGWHGSI
jgi:hypothetical protein